MQDSAESSKNIITRWEHQDQKNVHNKVLECSKDLMGISKNRVCTDIFCLSVFIVLNAGLLGLSYYISLTGDINRLGHGSDFRGDVCGVEGLKSREFTYYPDPLDLLISLCLKKCPKDVESESICYYDTDQKTIIKTYQCWDSYPTTEYGFYCFPKEKESRKRIIDEFFTSENLIRRAGGDLISVFFIQVWPIGLFGVLISICYSIAFIISLPFPSTCKSEGLVSFTIFSIIQNACLLPCMALLIYYNSLQFKSKLCEKNNSVNPDYCYKTPELGLRILTGIVGFSYFIYLLYLVFHRKIFFSALEIFKVVSEPINKVKRLVWIPVVLEVIGLCVLLGLYTLMLYSFGIGFVKKHKNNEVPGGEVNKLEFRNSDRLIMGFIIIMSFWWLSFLIGICEFIVGGVVGCWYFTKEKSVIFHPLSLSLKYCFRYHLGSIIRGSFYNLFLKFPSFFLEIFYKFLLRFNKNTCSLISAYFCWVCLSCYHFGLKYSSSSSFIYLAVFGLPYAQSSRESFYLKKRNQRRSLGFLAAPWHCMFQMKIAIALPGFIAVYAFLNLNQEEFLGISGKHLSSFLAPAVFVLVFCVFLGEVVTSALYSSVEAMALCVAADEEMFTAEQRFVKGQVQELLDSSYSETRKAEFIPVDTQKAGRSYRLPLNKLDFDSSFNARVSPIPKAFSPLPSTLSPIPTKPFPNPPKNLNLSHTSNQGN